MNFKTGGLTAAVIAGLASIAIPFGNAALADLIFQIGADNNFSGSGTPGTGPFGTVTLTDGTGTGAGGNGILVGTVQVSLALSPNVIANTSAADTLEFSLAGAPTITTADISNLLFTGPGSPSLSSYTLTLNPSVPNGANVTGFGIGIQCSSCPHGTSPPPYNALTFDITDAAGLSSSSFVAGDTAGYYFVADIGIVSGGSVIATGYSGALGPGSTPVPEIDAKSGLAALGFLIALLGLVGERRKRNVVGVPQASV